MSTGDLLRDAFGRVTEEHHAVLDGLAPELLTFRPDADANPIAWLLWHLTRVQDDHVAALAGRAQVWTAHGWYERFALPVERGDIGYGHDRDQVAAVTRALVEGGATSKDGAARRLIDYHDHVASMSDAYIAGADDAEWGWIVDTSWDPPVTAGVRLVSVLSDCLQHVGQAAYVRGLAERAS